ncbi:META domain-containing protein [Paeniglutamicibacter sp. R2-26]|uniref:META domain-containing protein n=1 Tax=Paeniglutamicibacter sp. R2-26 TaxID=3144417 RepID=UPI003EE604EC
MKRIAALALALSAGLGLAGCAASPGQEGAPVVGQWGGVPDGSPVLVFSQEGTFTGNDGCNTLGGSWTRDGDGIVLEGMTMTLMACEGLDTWLSSASSATVEGMNLRVFDAQRAEIGVLAHEGAAH